MGGGGRSDSQSNKNENVVMESKVVLILFRAPTEKGNTCNVGDGCISSYNDSTSPFVDLGTFKIIIHR